MIQFFEFLGFFISILLVVFCSVVGICLVFGLPTREEANKMWKSICGVFKIKP